jgi:hypothetical protein
MSLTYRLKRTGEISPPWATPPAGVAVGLEVAFYTVVPLFLLLCHWLAGRVVGMVQCMTIKAWGPIKGRFARAVTDVLRG